MAKAKNKVFDNIFSQLQELDGHAVLFDDKGCPSVLFEMTNPVQTLCTDFEPYVTFHGVLANLVQTLGEGYALQKQDIFCRQKFHQEIPRDAEFLTRSYFEYFDGRE